MVHPGEAPGSLIHSNHDREVASASAAAMIRLAFWVALVLSCALLLRYTVFSNLRKASDLDRWEPQTAGILGQASAMYQQLLGGYIKNIHYGGMDGVVTTFSVVAGVEGVNLAPRITLALGFASLFADALSMGVGEYISAAAEQDYEEHHPLTCVMDMRKEQIRKALLADQYAPEEVESLIQLLSVRTDLFNLSAGRANMPAPSAVDASPTPLKRGVVTFCAFLVRTPCCCCRALRLGAE